MAILKGFPPSSTISGGIKLPDVGGEAIVISNKDPLRMGRVRLSFGSWARPLIVWPDNEFIPPSVGTKVEWSAYSATKSFYYKANGYK